MGRRHSSQAGTAQSRAGQRPRAGPATGRETARAGDAVAPPARALPAALEALGLCLAAATPALFNPASVRVFEPEKVAFVRSVAFLMLALWALEAAASRRSPRDLLGGWRRTPFLPPVLALAAAYLAAALLAEAPAVSLLGSYRRQFGALTHLSFAAIFLVVAAHLRTRAQVERLLLAVAVGTAIPSLSALAERLGVGIVGPPALDRPGGTLGLSTYLGAHLAAAVPVSLHLLLRASSRAGRAAAAALLALQTSALLLSQTRASWLGAAAGLSVALALAAGPRLSPRALRAGAGVAAAVALLLAALNLPGTEFNRIARSVPYLERAASLGDFEAGSGRVRALIWQAAPALVFERPLLGHGPEMIGYAFERQFPPELSYAEGRTAFADTAHNVLLQVLLSAGLLGLAAYLWLLASALAALVAAMRRSRQPGAHPEAPSAVDGAYAPLALAGIVAGLVDGMAGVPSASATLLFWLYLAVAAAVAQTQEKRLQPVREGEHLPPGTGPGVLRPGPAKASSPGSSLPPGPAKASSPGSTLPPGPAEASSPGNLGSPWARAGLAILVLCVAGLAIVRLNLLPLLADVAAARAGAMAAHGRVAAAARSYRQALDLHPDAEYYLLLGQLATAAAERAPAAEAGGWLAQAERALEAAGRANPLDLDVALAQGRLYQTWAGRYGDEARWSRAETSFRRALDLSPRRTYVRNRYGAVLAARGRHREALEQYRLSLGLDPGYAATHGFMADSLVALGDLQEALPAYERARELDPKLVLVRINLAELYARMGRIPEAVGEYEAAVALAPEDPALRARLNAMRAASR